MKKKYPYDSYTASLPPLNSGDSIRIEYDNHPYFISRSIYPDQREYIGICSQVVRDNSELTLRIELQAARKVAEAILDLLDPKLVPVPTAEERREIKKVDEISTRNMATRWEQGEEALLFYLYVHTETPLSEIACIMGRTAFALRSHLRKLGVQLAPLAKEEAEKLGKET